MKSFVALALAASALATPMPIPQSGAPDGCSDSKDGSFQISVVNVTSSAKRSVEKRQLSGTLTVTLQDGILKDQAGRTGSIVANHQWQFDNPVQEDAISTSGFSICSNGSLAHGGSAVWHQCYSGGFYNIYDETIGDQCNSIYLIASDSSSGPVTQVPPVTQISDGQPQATTGAPVVSQITDGQPQAPTSGAPVSQISDGQPQAPTGVPVSQISDGQPQAPTGVPVSQISDGQPQAPTGVPVSQIPDGQPQAPTGPVITQISDGQPQVPTEAPAPVITQISDGQPQAPVATGNVTQISDGQPQAPVATATSNLTGNATSPSVPEFTGAAATQYAGLGAFAAAVFGLVALL
ncbi:hypothetical protein K458DRAFT_439871 [Lentithecium fluviatile CBS 122367]|uniref:Cell wall mannoprotein PIR1-like C-terminal domain-containing protein n=1 Tax=Lentithecium fluviatile CBS 122367 TaxID=1168545 RepID=A0A6G1JGB7_9PLEO|nr:hypothetical protein K458DRAFT_439871 [Lentithecium fluviatile CBS 122367]